MYAQITLTFELLLNLMQILGHLQWHIVRTRCVAARFEYFCTDLGSDWIENCKEKRMNGEENIPKTQICLDQLTILQKLGHFRFSFTENKMLGKR